MIGRVLATIKKLAKPVLRPIYRAGRKVLLRMLDPTIASLRQEIAELRTALEFANLSHSATPEPVRCLRPFDMRELAPAAKDEARSRLGIPSSEHVIVFAGTLRTERTARECLNSLEQIRYWGADSHLYFADGIPEPLRPAIEACVRELALAGQVHFGEQFESPESYRDLLIAADCAVALEPPLENAISGPLLDCLNAGLPVVCRDNAINYPGFVRTVSLRTSPLLIAEELWELFEESESHRRDQTFRARNAAEHRETNYSPQILKLLAAS